MKHNIAVAALSLFLASSKGRAYDPTFRPVRLSYDSLSKQDINNKEEGNDEFIQALSEVGLVSIHGVPGYASSKREVFSFMHVCMMQSSTTQEHQFPDGTLRRSLATHTVPGGVQKIFKTVGKDQKPHLSAACEKFVEASNNLRSIVASATHAFAEKLEESLEVEENILSTPDGYAFETIGEVVESGEHLEHFHSYQRTQPNNHRNLRDTIDLHTDQGLFIVFTPGLMVDHDTGTMRYPADGGFFVELEDGTRSLASFHEDDLVFMLGDGVNQVINSKVRQDGLTLRAVPHALIAPEHEVSESRVWYGRMILPPQGALHPDGETTFGELRRLMISESPSGGLNQESLGIGCSSSLVPRQMEEVLCEADTIFCWHRCMNHTDFAVSDDICAAQGQEMKCVNPRDQVYVSGHGDYYPGCTSSTEEATPYPTLPNYPRDESSCPDSEWKAFASDDRFDHSFSPNSNPEEDVSRFMWTKLDDGSIKARLAFNGIFGYLAFGFAGPPGSKKNGMHDASVIMALPGNNYSAVTGLDLNQSQTIYEYLVHPTGSAFRHWQVPVSNGDQPQTYSRASFKDSYEIESTDCFTAISFETDSINGIPFNVTGTDKVLWAGNAKDYYAGYHGMNRSVFCVNWADGSAFFESEKGAGCSKKGTNQTEMGTDKTPAETNGDNEETSNNLGSEMDGMEPAGSSAARAGYQGMLLVPLFAVLSVAFA